MPTPTTKPTKVISTRHSVSEVYDAVLDVKEIVLNVKGDMVDLKQHVNDELETMNLVIDHKLDDGQLLTSLGFSLLNNRWLRWIFGAAMAALFSTVAVKQWSGPVVEGIQHALQYLP